MSLQIQPNYNYIDSKDSYAQATNALNEMNIIGFDVETNGLDPLEKDLLLVQLGDEEKTYIFDPDWYPFLSKEEFWSNNQKLFIAHNAKFDLKFLKHNLDVLPGKIFDTLLAERILTCGFSRKLSLKEVAKKYLKLNVKKDRRKDFGNIRIAYLHEYLSNELLEYASLDVQILPLIYRKQNEQLLQQDEMKIASLEFEAVKVIAKMELAGIYIDTLKWQQVIQSNFQNKQAAVKKIFQILKGSGLSTDLFGGYIINLNSSIEIRELLTRFGIHIERADDTTLSQIKHPLVKYVREYRKYEKLLNSFGDKFLQSVRKQTSRVHPSFQQIGADTGRFSCTSPNLQQIPATEEYRSCFRSPKGRKIITCDYSQQELRVLASLSRDPKFIKMYKDGVDLHTATASMMFDIPEEKVEKENHRKIAKTINFGLAYGRGPKSLGITIGVSEEQAKTMIEKYFKQFSHIKNWLEQAALAAQRKGYSVTLLNRKRYYKIPPKSDPEYRSILSSIGRRGKNSPIQGSSVDMIKMALVYIDKQLEANKLDAFIINTVHDEIVVESSIPDAKKAAKIVQECMERAGRNIAPNVPTIAEANIGDYWTH
ncbi:MAG: DNA polymerase [Candidatus Dojkabacteria bacterium]|nr:DNA polymerase [Candidatus Dojkabacteria bacterium]